MGVKGENTRATILDAALNLARIEGLDALSIGRLAKGVGLSKSGLFSHFKSKETLQLQVLERGVSDFIEFVVRPALRQPRGAPRVRAMFEAWLAWANSEAKSGGCVFLGAAAEYDDRPGTVRDYLVKTQGEWLGTLARSVQIAKDEGHFDQGVDPAQFAFEIYGTMMAYHLYSRLLGDPDAESRARSAFETLSEHAAAHAAQD